MYKFKILLFFLVFGITCFVKSQEPEELYEKDVKEGDAEKSLQKIQPGKALPLVLLGNRFNKLLLPTNLHKVRSLDKKMIQGTDFAHPMKISLQTFFCPKSNTEKCLIDTPFNDNEALQCASEPIPILVREPEEIECGRSKIDFFYKVVYPLCEGKDQINTEFTPLYYRYCYDTNNQTTKFTVHTIKSPLLLSTKLLLREREVTYPIMMKDEPIVSTYRESEDAVDESSTSKLISPKAGYQWQKLVQSEDMALALWRKTTFHEINLALQHENLIKIWNQISEHVRSNGIEIFRKYRLHTVIYTGVFDLESATETGNNDQLSNTWVKLIMTTGSMKGNLSSTVNGMAILMNNFIDTGTSHSKPANSEGIEGYCNQNICLESLKNEFKNINGHIRCCLITPKILHLFNIEHIELDELFIPNVTFGEDQEILKGGTHKKTEKQIDETFRKIQSNEILPLILHWNPETQKISIPQTIQQIVTKNKRIVDGSKFFQKNQLFFCPKEDSKEICLVPRKFERFEPLQCTKLPVPVVQELTDNEQQIQCGAKGNGILYEVFYELCPDVLPEYKVSDMVFYEFCYDSTNQEILYTRHKILSEELLKLAPLFWEREVEFRMPTDSQLPLSNLKELQEAVKEENDHLTSSKKTKKSFYKLQKLVPSEDMAFAFWKLSTYLLINTALQHESLISLWKEINYYTQNQIVSRPYISTKEYAITSINLIYDGVLDILITSFDLGADQKSQIWFKIIHKKPSSSDFEIEEGIVILMQNFLVPKTDRSTSSDTEENNILKQFCEKNLCLDEFQRKFNEIGGQIWCCPLTTNIADFIGIPNVNLNNKVLFINKIIDKDIAISYYEDLVTYYDNYS